VGLGYCLFLPVLQPQSFLPLRIALFLASLVALAFISESLANILLRNGTQSELMQAGLYGITTFIIAVLVNLLSFWLRDYRLLAEKQALELTRLEQIE